MDQYWASVGTNEIASGICDKVRAFDRHLLDSGRAATIQRAMALYYGFDPDGKPSNTMAISFGGEQGEMVQLRLNHFRSLVDQRVIMVTGQRPSYQAMAENNDVASIEATQLADGIFEFQLTKRGLEDKLKEGVKRRGLGGEGWMSVLWDPFAGKPYAVDPVTQQVQRTGDVITQVHSMYDVIRDITRVDTNHDWLVLRTFVNKWDLAAQFPEKADAIIAATPKSFLDNQLRASYYRRNLDKNFDLVELFQFFHRPTASMSQGRYTQLVDDTVLLDLPLPYDELPLYMIAEDLEPDSPFGHSNDWDLMAPQQALDSAISAIATNHDAFAVKNVLIPKGCALTPADMGGALRGLNYNAAAGKPEIMSMDAPSAESYRLAEFIIQNLETISGVNAVARGTPQPSLKSGSALALVQSMAVQSSNGLSAAYVRFMEAVGTAIIKRYQESAMAPQLLEIVGVDKKSSIRTFKSDDLKGVQRIVVSVGGPMMRSQAGRVQIAENIADRWPEAVSPEQYFQVMETGRLEPVMRTPTAEPIYIQKENELLRRAIDPEVWAIEDHKLHIQEHRSLMFDLDIRLDPAMEPVRAVIANHILEHQQFLPPPDGSAPPMPGEMTAAVQSEAFGPSTPAQSEPKPRAEPSPLYQNTEGTGGQMPLMPMNPINESRTSPTGGNIGPQ